MLQLQTPVDIQRGGFLIEPSHRLLFVGSCFADNIGRIFIDNMFHAKVNPYGVMYNPASILHTVERLVEDDNMEEGFDTVVFTLGTNRVYILNETGEIVDNCRKRPQQLFTEKSLTIDECADYINRAIALLKQCYPNTKTIITVSPIRYAKYGFHGSQLSKATLLLAAEKVMTGEHERNTAYFPAYEIMNDELRDYRFYQPDMLHPSGQAVEYIFSRFRDMFFSSDTVRFMEEWQPIRRALSHRPFNADSEEYKAFISNAREKERLFKQKWQCKS